ncbi:MAG: coenzyme F420 biosynthesis-associated protein [Pseudonocardiaceae bacterium]|nr:coenzyme F420 biosynthesis-associated protein [Pseudonocardiaceae bacterium]
MDWSIAAATGKRLVRPGPVIPREQAEQTVHALHAVNGTAEQHVRELTGLGHGLPLHDAEVVDRPGWVQAATDGLATLTSRAVPRRDRGPLNSVLASSAGVQTGVLLAFLGSRVLGQYDPFGPKGSGGRLLLVAPNVVSAQQALGVSAKDFRMWVCLHECTHRLQFNAVPWLREYFAGEVSRLLSGLTDEDNSKLNRLPELIKQAREARKGDGALAVAELLTSPEQRVVLDRLIALSTLLEGHADHVMDAVGPSVVPSVATIRRRFTERRRGGGVLDRVLRVLLGVDAKVKQYAQGSAFTRHVVDTVGMDGFNVAWESPETLPTRAEITDPDAWLRRVRP